MQRCTECAGAANQLTGHVVLPVSVQAKNIPVGGGRHYRRGYQGGAMEWATLLETYCHFATVGGKTPRMVTPLTLALLAVLAGWFAWDRTHSAVGAMLFAGVPVVLTAISFLC